MATPPASAAGMRHNISLQQLNSFGMRNISIPGTHAGALMDLYFQIEVHTHVLYKSDVARRTLNPVWIPFDLSDALSSADSTFNERLYCATCFDVLVVQVYSQPSSTTERSQLRLRRKSRAISLMADEEWGGWEPNTRSFAETPSPPLAVAPAQHAALEEKEAMQSACIDSIAEEVVFQLRFNIRELDLLPVSLNEIANLPLNTCLFEFAGRTYVKREVIDVLADSGVIANRHARRKGSAIQVKEYSLDQGVDNLHRILALQQDLKQTTGANEALKDAIDNRIRLTEQAVSVQTKRVQLQERLRAARELVRDKRDALDRIKAVMQDECKTFDTDIHIPKALWSTMQMTELYREQQKAMVERRWEALRAPTKIRVRQAALVKELGSVYPIEYVGAGEYSIRGIKITTADLSLNSRADEELISTALGYIAHLVFMLSKYLHVSLRYRLVPFSSRSFLKDEVNDPNGEYPLYKKGVDKERYEKAMLFLKRDIDQLIFARGLDAVQSGPILGRLKALADAEISWLSTLAVDDSEPPQDKNGLVSR